MALKACTITAAQLPLASDPSIPNKSAEIEPHMCINYLTCCLYAMFISGSYFYFFIYICTMLT